MFDNDVKELLDQYHNLDFVKSLNMTDDEIIKNSSLIQQVLEHPANSSILLRLQRNKKGQIVIEAFPNTIQTIRSNYVYRDFPDSDFNLRLNKQTIGNQKIDSSKVKVLNLFMGYLNNLDQLKGAYIYGALGIGKTFITKALANELALKNKTVAFVYLPELINDIKSNFDINITNGTSANSQKLDSLKKVDVLFLDDIGAENSKSSWFYEQFLILILNFRMQNNKPTFFTSNISFDGLYKKIKSLSNASIDADRILDRIKALTGNKQYLIEGPNLRY